MPTNLEQHVDAVGSYPPGNFLQKAIENGHIEIVDLPN